MSSDIATAPLPHHPDTSTRTRLTGGWLTAARAAWFVIVGLGLALLVLGALRRFNGLMATDPSTLEHLGVPVVAYAIFHTGLDALYMGVYAVVALLMAARRSD